jgi:hypothetical protein
MDFNKNLTVEQLEDVVFDGAMCILNYGEENQRDLAPLKTGAKFEVTQTKYYVTRDGAISPEKGLVKVIEEKALATMSLIGMGLKDLKLAIAGAKATYSGDDIIKLEGNNGYIDSDDYIKNVAIVGETLNGDYKVCMLYNALGGNGLNFESQTKADTNIEIVLEGHKNPLDKSEPLWSIEDVSIEDVYTLTINIVDDTEVTPLPISGVLVYFNGITKITNTNGQVVFNNILDGTYDALIAKEGFTTVVEPITIDGENKTSTIEFLEI